MRASIEESVFSQTITEEITSVDEDGTVEEAEESKQGGLMDESEESDDININAAYQQHVLKK